MVPYRIILHFFTLAFLFTASMPYPAPLLAQYDDGVGAAAVAPALRRALQEREEPLSFLVILEEQPDVQMVLQRPSLRAAGRQDVGRELYAYLVDFATRSQADLRAWLDARGVSYRPFYIVNAIEVTGDAGLVAQIQKRPEVNRLSANPGVQLSLPPAPEGLEPEESPAQILPSTVMLPATPYGIRHAKAPDVWGQGFTGQGVVIAGQDTGVMWDHPALQPKYRGWDADTQTADHAYNWYDPWGANGRPGSPCPLDPQVPCDDHGHGTHTMGTLVGSDSAAPGGPLTVGMAPDAQWIACRNMLRGVGTPGSYAACFQFFLAPFPQGGDPFVDGDPARAPDIINNSWYCPPEEGCDIETLRQVVATVRAAGIMIVASAGNQGPFCSSVQYPISAYDEVFSVGAHNGAGAITPFSSRGPVLADGSGRLKPDITAPGDGILSTALGGSYTTLNGTSMASPHAAGALALLWSARPELKGALETSEQILLKSAVPVPFAACGDGFEPTVPNNTYGYGRLDVQAAVEMARNPIALTVDLRWDGGPPASDAQIELIDRLTGYRYHATSDAKGQVRVGGLYPGEYLLVISRLGFVHEEPVNLVERDETLAIDIPVVLYVPWVET